MNITKKYLHLLFIILLVQTVGQVAAQPTTLSPYSRYGIGELLFKGYAHQRAMGGIGIGLYQPGHLNFLNPASYFTNDTTMFELGVEGTGAVFKNSEQSQKKANGSVSYLSMGFPLIKYKWYLTMGFLPYSALGYSIVDTKEHELHGSISYLYDGTGGYNRFYAGTGLRLSKNFSAGVNASFLFGTTSRTNKVQFSESGYFSTMIDNQITLQDLLIEGGLQYHGTSTNGLEVTFGLTAAPKQEINAKRTLLWQNYILRGGNAIILPDTVLFLDKEKGVVTLPAQAGFGFSIGKSQKWMAGADVSIQQWKDFESFGEKQNTFNSYKVALGSQFVPDPKAKNAFASSAYRLGGFYNSGSLEINNSPITEMGVTFGASIPLRSRPLFSTLNIAFELSKRGTTSNNLVQENYGRLIIGLTLREEWFGKNKFE